MMMTMKITIIIMMIIMNIEMAIIMIMDENVNTTDKDIMALVLVFTL